MSKRLYFNKERTRMSYSEYGFYRRTEAESRYEEYGDPRQSGSCSIIGSSSNSSKPAKEEESDADYERFIAKMRALKQLEEDGYAISPEERKAIIKGDMTIEDLKSNKLIADERALESSETTVQEPLDETPVKPYG